MGTPYNLSGMFNSEVKLNSSLPIPLAPSLRAQISYVLGHNMIRVSAHIFPWACPTIVTLQVAGALYQADQVVSQLCHSSYVFEALPSCFQAVAVV